MKRFASIILLSIFLSACTVKTEVIRTNDGYIIKSKRNALVEVKGDHVRVDNRNLWYLEMLLSDALAKTDNSIHIDLENLDDKEVD